MINKYIDLHCHMDGAITIDIAKELAKLQNIKLPEGGDEVLLKKLTLKEGSKDLNDFLACFEYPLELLQTKEGITKAVELILEKAKENGAVYMELRYAPQLHCVKGLSQEDAIVAAIDGVKNSSLKANLILCCMRGNGNDKENEETLNLAKKYLVEDGGVVAIDLAGAEALFKTENYEALFKKANEMGVPFTIHAGEADGPKSIKDAISFGAKRIGHGIRSLEDEEVLKLVKEKGITFEMCPTSNIQTCVLDEYKDYPILKLLEMGIHVTINSDDPGIEGVNIAHEYSVIKDALNVSDEQFKEMLRNSVNAAFTSNEVKESLRKELGI